MLQLSTQRVQGSLPGDRNATHLPLALDQRSAEWVGDAVRALQRHVRQLQQGARLGIDLKGCRVSAGEGEEGGGGGEEGRSSAARTDSVTKMCMGCRHSL